MLTIPMHENELCTIMDQLLLMLDLSSEAVYHLRKYMDNNSDATEKHEATMAINYLVDYGFDTIKDIECILQNPTIMRTFSEWMPYDPSETKAR